MQNQNKQSSEIEEMRAGKIKCTHMWIMDITSAEGPADRTVKYDVKTTWRRCLLEMRTSEEVMILSCYGSFLGSLVSVRLIRICCCFGKQITYPPTGQPRGVMRMEHSGGRQEAVMNGW